jgi:ribonuclease D
VARGLEDPNPPQIPRRRGHRPTDAEQKRFVVMESLRNARAEALDLDPTLIASRATLLLLSRDWETYQSVLMPWQRELLS